MTDKENAKLIHQNLQASMGSLGIARVQLARALDAAREDTPGNDAAIQNLLGALKVLQSGMASELVSWNFISDARGNK